MTLGVYAQVMDRSEAENERLRALVEGEQVTSVEPVHEREEVEA